MSVLASRTLARASKRVCSRLGDPWRITFGGEMKEKLSLRLSKQDLSMIRSSPSVLLAYYSLRSVFRIQFKSETLGLTVCVVPEGHRTRDYKMAAQYLFEKDSPVDWTNPDKGGRVFEVLEDEPQRSKKDSVAKLSIFDLSGIVIIVTSDVGKIPAEIRFAAEHILQLSSPTGRQIRAVRRVFGNHDIADDLAGDLATRSQAVIVAAIARRNLTPNHMTLLAMQDTRFPAGPGLDELPGYDELKAWARSVRGDIELWRRGGLDWAMVSRGALLSGPPGTGKTAFAAAFANSCGFQLVIASVGSWQAAGHLDDTLVAMRAAFVTAARAGGAVLFVDEIDGIGNRGSLSGDNAQYWRVVINEFLALTSQTADGVIMIGATNFPDEIDPAILRSGRIEEKFVLSMPDPRLRAEILAFHLDAEIVSTDLTDIADDLDEWSGSDLEKLARDVKRRARARGKPVDIQDVLTEAPQRQRLAAQDHFRIAIHEAGHALVAVTLEYSNIARIVVRDTFDPSRAAFKGGLTRYDLVEEMLPTERSLEKRIAVALAGLAAEEVVLGDRSIGSGGGAGDLDEATSIAKRMVAAYGFGPVPLFLLRPEEVNARTRLPPDFEAAAREIVRTQYARVLAMLKTGKDRLLALARDVVEFQNVVVFEQDGLPSSEPSTE